MRLPKIRAPHVSISARGLTAIFAAVTVAATGVGVRTSSGQESPATTQTAAVGRGVVYRTVSTTGELQAVDEVELTFPTSGELTELVVAVGDHVTTGQLLARIDSDDAQRALEEAEADLASERARLTELVEGLSPAESQQRQLEVADAQARIDDANTDLTRAEQDADSNRVDRERTLARAQADLAEEEQEQAETQAELDDAQSDLTRAKQRRREAAQAASQLEIRADELEVALEAAQDALEAAQDAQTAYDRSYEDNRCNTTTSATCDEIRANQRRAEDAAEDAQDVISDIQDEQSDLQADQTDTAEDLTEAEQDENEAQGEVDRLEGELEAFPAQLQQLQRSLEDATATAWDGALQDDRTVQNARTAINDAQRAYESQLASNAVAGEGASAADILSAQASIRTAQIGVEDARDDLDDTSMYAPTDGVVSSVSGEVGDDVGSSSSGTGTGTESTGESTSTSFLTITDVSGFEATMSVNETDIADLEVGQPANVSVDALDDTVLPAIVTSVAPATGASENVVAYDVTVLLARTAEQLRAGMTVGVDVIVEQVDGALHVPTAAVTGSGDAATVTVVADDGTQEQRTVTLGIEGDDSVEIVSGLAEGEAVAIAGAAAIGIPSGGDFPGGGPPGGFGGGGVPGGGGLGGGGPRP